MATRTAQVCTLDDGLVRVVLTYDDLTMRVSRVEVVNTSTRAITLAVSHPTTGNVITATVAAGATVGRNVPGNRTLTLCDSREGICLGDDWPTIAVQTAGG